MSYHSGRHFLQIPGPSNVPDRVLRAIDRATIDHRGPAFAELTHDVLRGLQTVFATEQPVVVYPSSGTGAWEAALVNTLSPGDKVLMVETGQFAAQWCALARRLGVDVELLETDWRRGVDPDAVGERLRADAGREIKALCCVHNETATGATSRIGDVRAAIDAASHPALLLVDAVSSLGSVEYLHDAWGVDVTISGSQKGLMLPPGLGFNAVSKKALRASQSAALPRSYWRWDEMLAFNDKGFFPYTPATNLLYGLREALTMLIDDEGLPGVFARHLRHAEATRRAAAAWGLELQVLDSREYSPTLTALRVPDGHSADRVRKLILEHFDMSLGTGLGQLADRVFRIGHLGDLNDLTMLGTLGGVEMGLRLAGVPISGGGSQAALDFLTAAAQAEVS